MTQISRYWSVPGLGHAPGLRYDAETDIAEVEMALSGAAAMSNRGGVFRGVAGALEVTGTASPVSVAAGMAQVWGTWYKLTAAEEVAVATPSSDPRIDRVVLRKDWAAQTVTLELVAGAEDPAPQPPALTQNEGTVWEIPLAQLSIGTDGVITVTDQRQYLTPGGAATGGAATGALVPIATVTVPDMAPDPQPSEIEFTNIPQDGIALWLISTLQASGSLYCGFNGEYGGEHTEYDAIYMYAALSYTPTILSELESYGIWIANPPGVNTYFMSAQAFITRYAEDAIFKTVSYNYVDVAEGEMGIGSGYWRNTAPISSITLFFDDSQTRFAAGSVFTLYKLLGEP